MPRSLPHLVLAPGVEGGRAQVDLGRLLRQVVDVAVAAASQVAVGEGRRGEELGLGRVGALEGGGRTR